MNNLQQTIYSTIQRVAKTKSLEIEAIREEDALVDNLGLRSLDLARIIATLELQLDLDPFTELVSITSVRTVGDLCAAYDKCLSAQTAAETQGNDSVPEMSTPEAEPAAEISETSTADQQGRRQRALRKSVRDRRA